MRYQLPVVTSLRGPTQKLLESFRFVCLSDPANDESLWEALKTAICIKEEMVSTPSNTQLKLPSDVFGQTVYTELANHILNELYHTRLPHLG